MAGFRAGRIRPSGGVPPGGQIGGGTHLATHGAKHLAAGALAKTLATLAVGGVLGAGVHEAYDRTHDRRGDHAKVSTVNAPAPPPAPAIAAAPLPPADPWVPEGQVAPSCAQAGARRARRGSGARSNLAGERALIEQARTALSRDKAAAALAALERHARDFPRGDWKRNERALRFRPGRIEPFDQAHKVGARFHRRFPRSIFGECGRALKRFHDGKGRVQVGSGRQRSV